ncbi:hypothetical protein Tco_1007172 [Tanacetum coccineum]
MLEYNNGEYDTLTQPKVMKAELLKLGLHNENNVEESASLLVNKTPLFKTWFPTALRILVTFFIQVLGGNKSSTNMLNLNQKPRKGYVVYSRFLSCVLEILLSSYYTHVAVLGCTPSVLRLPSTHPDEGIRKLKPLPEGTPIDP